MRSDNRNCYCQIVSKVHVADRLSSRDFPCHTFKNTFDFMTVLNGWLETVSICRLSLYIQHEHSASLRGFIAVC